MTDDEMEERQEFVRRLFGTKPEQPVDNDSDNRNPDIEMNRFTHRLFNRDND